MQMKLLSSREIKNYKNFYIKVQGTPKSNIFLLESLLPSRI